MRYKPWWIGGIHPTCGDVQTLVVVRGLGSTGPTYLWVRLWLSTFYLPYLDERIEELAGAAAAGVREPGCRAAGRRLARESCFPAVWFFYKVSLVNSSRYVLTRWLTRWITYSVNRSLTRWFTHSVNRLLTLWLTRWITHSVNRLLTLSDDSLVCFLTKDILSMSLTCWYWAATLLPLVCCLFWWQLCSVITIKLGVTGIN